MTTKDSIFKYFQYFKHWLTDHILAGRLTLFATLSLTVLIALQNSTWATTSLASTTTSASDTLTTTTIDSCATDLTESATAPIAVTNPLAKSETTAHTTQFDLAKGRKIEVYATGRGPSGHIVRMTAEEFRTRADKETIRPDDILVVDSLDLEANFPLVAGVIVAQPFPIEGAHPQALAQKMQIPLVYVEGITSDPAFNEYIKNSRYISLEATKDSAHLIGSDEPYVLPTRQSALPKSPPSKEKIFIYADSIDPDKYYDPEIYGDKFLPLARLTTDSTGVVFSAASNGFYEAFIDTAFYQGVSLREFIRSRIDKLNEKPDAEIHQKLAEIRQAFLESAAIDGDTHFQAVFEPVYKYFKAQGKTSVRSNNAHEDLIGSGVYDSSVSASGWPIPLLAAIRKVYSSLYTYRAFKIRRAQGMREEYTSMPLLLHQYLDNEVYNGLATATIDANDDITMKFQLVEGDQTRATNPSANAKITEVSIVNRNGEYEIHAPGVEDDDLLSGIKLLYKEIYPRLRLDFLSRQHAPEKLDFELLFLDGGWSDALVARVLQYKLTYPIATVLQVLSGELERADLDQPILPEHVSARFDKNLMANTMQAVTLNGFDMNRGVDDLHMARFVLLEYKGENVILIWTTGTVHEGFKQRLRRNFSDARWLRSGTVYVSSDQKLVAFKYAFPFTDQGTSISVDSLRQAFLAGLKNTQPSSTFQKWLSEDMSRKVQFKTFDTPYPLEFLAPAILEP